MVVSIAMVSVALVNEAAVTYRRPLPTGLRLVLLA